MGVIYLINTQKSEEIISKNCKIIKSLITHKFLNGKPFLMLGTFQDESNVLSVFEFSSVYDFEMYATKGKTPVFADVCDINSYKSMEQGLIWMMDVILKNFRIIKNRIDFDSKIKKNDVTDHREGTRPSTAPPNVVKKKRKKIQDLQSLETEKKNLSRIIL